MNTSALPKVMHREAKTMSDKVAVLFVRLLRYVSHLNLMDARAQTTPPFQVWLRRSLRVQAQRHPARQQNDTGRA